MSSMQLKKHKMNEHSRSLNISGRSILSINHSTRNNSFSDALLCEYILKDDVEITLGLPLEEAVDRIEKVEEMNREVPSLIKCDICNIEFENQSKLSVHKEIEHVRHPTVKFQCISCSIHFLTDEALKEHVRTDHGPNLATFECDKCSYSFINALDLSSHIWYLSIQILNPG